MKILVDFRLFVKGKRSGVEEYTRLLFLHLLARDRENVYTFFYNGFPKAPLPEEWERFPNVSVVRWNIPDKIFDLAERFLGEPKIDRYFDADIVVSPHLNVLSLKEPRKRVLVLHDLSFEHFPEFFTLRKRLWHRLQNVRAQAETARHIVANSDFTRYDVISTLRIPGEKVRTIYPGVNPFYKAIPKDDEMLQRFRGAHGLNVPFLLFVGVIEPRKNVETILRAFNALKSAHRDLKLVLAGEVGWRSHGVVREARMSPYADDVIFWGPATYEELLFLYNTAAVFVYPSFFEGFGFPPLEAQACGLPVVASNRASLPEVVGDAGLFVDPWRPSELTRAIRLFLDDEKLRNLHRERGFENTKRFRWEKTAEQFLSLFRSMING